jgi:hypothetical protein
MLRLGGVAAAQRLLMQACGVKHALLLARALSDAAVAPSLSEETQTF